jgi:hypothetical protein
MSKLTLDDVFRIQDAVSELLEANVGKEFLFRRGMDSIDLTFVVAPPREVNEPEHRDKVPADRHVVTPALDADQEEYERHLRESRGNYS